MKQTIHYFRENTEGIIFQLQKLVDAGFTINSMVVTQEFVSGNRDIVVICTPDDYNQEVQDDLDEVLNPNQ